MPSTSTALAGPALDAGVDREPDGDAGPLAGLRVQRDLAAELSDHLAADRQPEAVTVVVGRIGPGQPEKRFEDAVDIFRRDARPVVGDGHAPGRALDARGDTD